MYIYIYIYINVYIYIYIYITISISLLFYPTDKISYYDSIFLNDSNYILKMTKI